MPKTKKNKIKKKMKNNKYINTKFTKKRRLNKKHKILSNKYKRRGSKFASENNHISNDNSTTNIKRIINGNGIIEKDGNFYYIRVKNLFVMDESGKTYNIGNNPEKTVLLAKQVSNKKDITVNISRNEGVGLHITLGYSHKVNSKKLDSLIGSLVSYDVTGIKEYSAEKKYWIVLKVKINSVGDDKSNINTLLNSTNSQMLHITIGVGHLKYDDF